MVIYNSKSYLQPPYEIISRLVIPIYIVDSILGLLVLITLVLTEIRKVALKEKE